MKKPKTFVFPFPPSVNSMYSQGKNHGQKFMSKKTRLYKKAVVDLYKSQDIEKMSGNLMVGIILVPPTSAKRDVDNYVKALLDGLVDIGAIEDDSQIKDINPVMVDKSPRYNRGFAMITVSECDEARRIRLRNRALHIMDIIESTLSKDSEELLLFIKPTKKNPL